MGRERKGKMVKKEMRETVREKDVREVLLQIKKRGGGGGGGERRQRR